MLPKVSIGRRGGALLGNVESYRLLISDELFDEVFALARELRGVRICHINSTAFGGGVAELLTRYLPALQALGVSADWRLVHGRPATCRSRSSPCISRSTSRVLRCSTLTTMCSWCMTPSWRHSSAVSTGG